MKGFKDILIGGLLAFPFTAVSSYIWDNCYADSELWYLGIFSAGMAYGLILDAVLERVKENW